MKTFKKYLLEQLFEAFLLEMPHINLATSKENYASSTVQVPSLLANIHSSGSSEHIGGDNYYNNFKGSHVYYHLHNDKPREYSVITKDHVQTMTSKSGGDSKNIHKFMQHHIDTHKNLVSSDHQTPGSKKLWKDFIKNSKSKFSAIHKTGTKSDLPEDLDKLWSTDKNSIAGNTTIHATN